MRVFKATTDCFAIHTSKLLADPQCCTAQSVFMTRDSEFYLHTFLRNDITRARVISANNNVMVTAQWMPSTYALM